MKKEEIEEIERLFKKQIKQQNEYISEMIKFSEKLNSLLENVIDLKKEITELNKNLQKENKILQIGISMIILLQTIISILK